MELSWSFYRLCAWEGADPSSFKILLLITSYLGMTHYFCRAEKNRIPFFFPSYHMIENSDVVLPFLLWNKYCCHHDQGSPHDICSIFFKCWKRSQFSTLSNRSMLMSRQTKTLPRGGTPPKNGRGGRKQHVQTSGARPWQWRVSRISSPSGWPNEICLQELFFSKHHYVVWF